MSKESLENFLLPPKRGSIMYEFFFFLQLVFSFVFLSLDGAIV